MKIVDPLHSSRSQFGRAIELVAGRVWVSAPGAGRVFAFDLPAAAPEFAAICEEAFHVEGCCGCGDTCDCDGCGHHHAGDCHRDRHERVHPHPTATPTPSSAATHTPVATPTPHPTHPPVHHDTRPHPPHHDPPTHHPPHHSSGAR